MGYLIGMPCLKLNNVGSTSKKCGDFGSVAREALEERQGRDKDIDHSKTADNIYSGFRSAAELEDYSRRHIEELSTRQVANGGRKVRSDAVVMISTVIKPPAALMNSLSREEQIQFLQDADDKLTEIVGADNCKSTVIHFDEQGAHLHKFWEPMTDDGRLCAKEKFNLKFFSRLNKEIPAHLRSCGWDMVEDCKAYDAAAEKLKSEEQKAEERKQKGLTSVQYKAQAEAMKNEICEQIDELKGELKAVQEPAADLREIYDIADRAKHKKQLWRSETVTLKREDYEKLKAQAAHGAAVDMEVQQLRAEIKKRDERIAWLEDKAQERAEELGKHMRRINELEELLDKHEGLLKKIFSWITGHGKEWKAELDRLHQEYNREWDEWHRVGDEMLRAGNAARKAEREKRDLATRL